jgi:hypothetical protein
VSKGFTRADAWIRDDGVDDVAIARIDGILALWRQGDVVLQEEGFVHLADLASPLTEEAEAAQASVGSGMDDPSIAGVYTAVPGVVVLSQTCDIVRSCCERPFVEVAPLLEVDEARLRETKRALVVNRAYVPGMAARRLVADLDRVMTVEKAVLARWPRTLGCSTDAEARAFSEALGRKRARPAFPDDFVAALARLQRRIRDKHGRKSSEGQLLEALREIRIHAARRGMPRKSSCGSCSSSISIPRGLRAGGPTRSKVGSSSLIATAALRSPIPK